MPYGFFKIAELITIIDTNDACRMPDVERAAAEEVVEYQLKRHEIRLQAVRIALNSPPKKPKKIIKKLRSFADAHKRLLLEGKVPDRIGEYRLTVCTGLSDGERVSKPCPRYDGKNDRCVACGCPDWKIAKMTLKVWYPADICPLQRFSIAAGRRKKKPQSETSSTMGLEKKSE